MGSCYKCGSQISLKEEETRCDNCNTILRYWCNLCSVPFDIINKETSKKLKECSACGFFYCPHCGVCSPTCPKNEWKKIIQEIIGIIDSDKLEKLVVWIEQLKLGKEHRKCPFGVPISYAKDKIKYAAARMQGYDVRNNKEMELFEKRLKEIENLSIGTEFTIGIIREDGVYGQEYRDVCNYCLCLGLLKIEYKTNEKTKREFCLFIRENKPPCKYLILKDLVKDNWCPKCKKYSCGQSYKKGKEKGISHHLVKKITNEDVCQLSRSLFKHGRK